MDKEILYQNLQQALSPFLGDPINSETLEKLSLASKKHFCKILQLEDHDLEIVIKASNPDAFDILIRPGSLLGRLVLKRIGVIDENSPT